MTGVLGKLAVDIAMYQMYAALVLWWTAGETPHTAGTLSALAAAFLLALPEVFPQLSPKRGRPLLLAGAAAVLLCGFLFASAAQRIAYVPLAAYLLAAGVTQKWHLDYQEQKTLFRRSFYGWFLVPAVCLLRLHAVGRMLTAVLPWTLFYMVLGFIRLRQLRDCADGAQNREKLLRQFLELAVLFLVCLLLEAGGVLEILLSGLRSLFLYALRPLLTVLINAVAWLLNRLRGLHAGEGEEEEIQRIVGAAPDFDYETGWQLPDILPLIGTAAAVIAAAVLLIVLLRRLLGSRQREAAEGIEESRESLDGAARARRRRLISRDPAQAVRDCFARYMVYLGKKEELPEPADTSRRLADRGIGRMPEKAEAIGRLRELYLPARYRDEPGCTRQERKEAVRLWKEISR